MPKCSRTARRRARFVTFERRATAYGVSVRSGS
jgi:hypothetical protein